MEDPVSNIATSIRDELGSLPVVSPLRCIYKVPQYVRKVKEESYQPWTVSIGPIYHQHPSLQAMEKQKLRHLERFLTQGNNAIGLESYIGLIKEWEQEIRRCYEMEVSLSSHDFIKMVLLDATFIIDLFMWSSFRFSLENHPIDGIVEVFSRVERDLFLEENQLPFFVLKGLYDIAFGMAYPHISFIDLTWSYMGCGFMPGKEVENTITSEKIRQKGPNIKHFVDFLRICCLPSKNRPNPNSIGNRYPLFPLSATQLSEVGVKFIASKGSSLLDIRFRRGVLEIPKFTIQDTTEAVYRNILIFEHCHYFLDSHFIDYIFFLDSLINTPEDVEVLVRKGIIENWIGSNEAVANLFNEISKHISLCSSNFYYYDVCRDLNAYANTSWHRWKAVLSKDYFNHPWAIISVIYAILLLVLTLLQTISGFTSK
ncbi:UPF0481 protein At3g47200-like [Silene latifolia]|uniref:UPF0481 protein At3g47200-like n=1 Tax=Silene latifolia TaxID=37657 RepID=UPI003D779FB0